MPTHLANFTQVCEAFGKNRLTSQAFNSCLNGCLGSFDNTDVSIENEAVSERACWERGGRRCTVGVYQDALLPCASAVTCRCHSSSEENTTHWDASPALRRRAGTLSLSPGFIKEKY